MIWLVGIWYCTQNGVVGVEVGLVDLAGWAMVLYTEWDEWR